MKSRPPAVRVRRSAEPIAEPIAAAPPVFTVAADVIRSVRTQSYLPRPGDPRVRSLRIFTLDPSVSRFDGAVATVQVPWEPLAPGPVGEFLEVDASVSDADVSYERLDLEDPRILATNGRSPSITDPLFHQQMVYAVASLVVEAFRRALGRDPSWGFGAASRDAGPRLVLRPFADRMENSYYDPARGEVRFGYFTASSTVGGPNLPGGLVFTSLSHDVIAHETTHALLDGLRPRFREASGPDVQGLHEGFADVVSILLHFSYPQVVRAALRNGNGSFLHDEPLTVVAQQFGQTTGSARPLRSAIEADRDKPRLYEENLEPHAIGSLLTTALFEAFSTVYGRRTARLMRLASWGGDARGAGLPEDLEVLLSEEASTIARQFLRLCIRAIDYCPPVDPDLGNYLRALITADVDLVPEDPWGYREAIIQAFARHHIYPRSVPNLSEDALIWGPSTRSLPPCRELALTNLRFDGDPGRSADRAEIVRQAGVFGAYVSDRAHIEAFGLALPGDRRLRGDAVSPPEVVSIRPLRRVGPDGDLRLDLVAEVVQRRQLKNRGQQHAEFFGGATVLFDSYGRPRYVVSKNVFSGNRAGRYREFLQSPPGSVSHPDG